VACFYGSLGTPCAEVTGLLSTMCIALPVNAAAVTLASLASSGVYIA